MKRLHLSRHSDPVYVKIVGYDIKAAQSHCKYGLTKLRCTHTHTQRVSYVYDRFSN